MPDEPEWFTLGELTERLAQLIWTAEALAEILAGWASVEVRHRAAIVFAEAGEHHRWHGETLRRCLPTSEQLAEHTRIIAPADWNIAAETMRTLVTAEDSHVRLLVLQRQVYPWLEREVASLLDVASAVSDRHVLRWLRFVSLDHSDHARRLRALASDFESAPSRLSDRSVLAAIHLTSR